MCIYSGHIAHILPKPQRWKDCVTPIKRIEKNVYILYGVTIAYIKAWKHLTWHNFVSL